MTYTRVEREVTVKFTVNEFGNLLGILGAALVMSRDVSPELCAAVGQFIDELNRTNNDFVLYLKEVGNIHDQTPS